MHSECWWEGLKEIYDLQDLGVNGRIILKWILRNTMEGRRLD